MPGRDGDSAPFGTHTVQADSLRASERWIKERDSDYDYGAITLKDPVGSDSGSFAFASFDDAAIESSIANIAGYPADRDRATHQYFHARTITRQSKRRLYYDIDTFGGQSGSPIWIQDANDQRIAVGIHTTGASSINVGTRINEEVLADMRAWNS